MLGAQFQEQGIVFAFVLVCQCVIQTAALGIGVLPPALEFTCRQSI
jgi:hypothetical protein